MSDHSISYKQAPPSGTFDALVIGSGMGGMTTASLLARAGKRVLVLEKHYTPGGFTHVFKRKRFEWDVGLHYVGDVGSPDAAMRRMFDYLTDGALEWADMGEVYDRAVFAGTEYQFVKGTGRFRERMKAYFPQETEAIDRYVEMVYDASRKARNFFAEKAMPAPVGFLAGGFMRHPYMKYAGRTTAGVLAELTSNVELRGVLCSQYGDYGLPPALSSFAMHAMVAKHYFGGGYYPVGGSSRIFETIAPSILAAGGVVCTNAEVERILIENNRAVGVRMIDGREYRAGAVVSSVGVHNTFESLLAREQASGQAKAAASIEASACHLSLYIGLNRTASELRLPKANYWVFPDYDHDENVRRHEADPDAPLPVTYISFPSAKDPDFERRYPGRSTIEIITVTNWEHFSAWAGKPWKKRGDTYEALKEALAQRMLTALYKLEPQVRDAIESYELSTPLSTAHFTGWSRGEIYGLAHTPERFALRDLRPRTGVRNLWLTGQDVVTCGIGGALMGGVLSASAMLGRNVMGDMLARQGAS